ncbi:putative receptor-like protein kinase At4g00960 [Papaver somniferum]|uniref:putative receptor-like protein kinase At4g00960 n=1 Tax=Papaver somniferum TaxID=3469 RepID=UPI000E6F7AA8|nr:putative receptor-like protein kinase At4g00960 [Papaver somniferum]
MVIRNKKMGCLNQVSILFICLLFSFSNLLITIQYTTAQAFYPICLGDSNYTTNSTFQTNLNLLLPLLSTAANNSIIVNNGYYYYATVGQTPDTVYGSFQCRGGVTLDACQSCVKVASQEIKEDDGCPNSKQAIIRFDICMLMYSNQYYFNTMEDKPRVPFLNDESVTDPDRFRPILANLLKRIATEAVVNKNITNFAIGDANYTNGIRIYVLVQCTADIPPFSCYDCLVGAISYLPDCCDGSRGARFISPSCSIRYELYPFNSANAPPPPPPQSSSTAPLVSPNANGNNSSKLAISIVVPSVIAVLSAISFWFFCFWIKKTKTRKFDYVNDEVLTTESLQFNFGTVSTSTDNFSEANKLGQGGFGAVYKGTLSDSWQEIAVKRLSKHSGQGEQEFKNEVTLVAKLQHRNLVKLVGFSLAGEEKLLIYEYMPNGSLDQFLFDPVKRIQLDWERRSKIIRGVARGLLYLHEEYRLKIIHRDLKASNILLDTDMNPKIADFDMARLFVLDQTEASTNRIVGTHGYMAPEYVRDGEFSVKSDVFSFGVLVLEILCGKRNSSFRKTEIARELLSYAWRHWNNGSDIEILDPTLKDACSRSEVMRFIHVALLCVQEIVAYRPTMPTVVLMLNNSVTSHDLLSSPAFFTDTTRHIEPHPSLYLGYSGEQGNVNGRSSTVAANWSVNEVSVSELYPR